MRFQDCVRGARDAFKFGMRMLLADAVPTREVRGDVFLEMRDARTGDLLHKWEKREKMPRSPVDG